MSVVSDLHRQCVKGKFIFKAPISFISYAFVLFTIVGIIRCKNVDKISEDLIFRYNEDASITTLDPAYIKSQAEIWVASQLYNGLVELDSNLNPIPMLARSWTLSEDACVYKFVLRRDVQFHGQGNASFKQGRWVTAQDVAFSFSRLLDPATASPGAWIFSDKIDSLAFTKGPSDPNYPFQVQNDSVFVLKLKRPFTAMIHLLATSYCSIVPKDLAGIAASDFARKPIGTGPFYFKMWEEDVKLILRKNPLYFEFWQGKRLPFLEAINVDFIKNKQTAFMRFVAGEYDFFNGIEGSFKDELLTKEGLLRPKYAASFDMLSLPFLNTEYLGFWIDNKQLRYEALGNIHFRRALNFAVDRASILKYLKNNTGIIGSGGFVPPTLVNASVKGYSYNPTLAAAELKLAGYPNGENCPEIKITTTADYLDMAVYVQKYWQNLGLKVRIDVQTGGMLRQMRNKGELPVFRGSWIADYADAENYLACFYSKNHSPSGPNYTHFTSATFDRLYEQMNTTADPILRNQLVAQADSVIMAEAPIIVLYYDKSIRLIQKPVHGLRNDAMNRLLLKKVWKAKKSS